MSHPCCHEYCDMMMSYCLGQDSACPTEEDVLHRCKRCLEGACERWKHEALVETPANELGHVVSRGKSRLMQCLDKPEHHFAPLQSAFAQFLQTDPCTGAKILADLRQTSTWDTSLDPGVARLCMPAPTQATSQLQFLRLAPGCNFSKKLLQDGLVQIFILEGALELGDQGRLLPGCSLSFAHLPAQGLSAGPQGLLVAVVCN